LSAHPIIQLSANLFAASARISLNCRGHKSIGTAEIIRSASLLIGNHEKLILALE
jgi:hypothetical protein